MSSEEDLPIGQSYVYYKKGGDIMSFLFLIGTETA